MFCRQQVAELTEHAADFDDKNRHLAVIGSAEPSALPDFREKTEFRGTLLTDPSLRSFEVLGFERNIAGLVGWRPFAGAIKALRAGYRPGAVRGNVVQLGGALVVATDGRVLFHYRSSKAGDHPSVEQLLGGD